MEEVKTSKTIEELWDSVRRLSKGTEELKKQNENKVDEIFESIIDWCTKTLIDCKCSLPNVIKLGMNVSGYGYDKELLLYCSNCHSFKDWKGACFTAGRYGDDRNNDYLKVFVIRNWQEIKSKIIEKLAEEQAKVVKRHIADYERETELEKDLERFEL